MLSILRQRWRQPRRRFPTRPPPGVLLQPPDRRFHQRQLQDAHRPERLQFPGCCLRALAPGRGRPPGALAHPPLDVSPQAVLEDLRLPSRFDGPASPDVLTKPVLSRPAAPFTSNPGLGTIIELATVRSINSPQSWRDPPFVIPSGLHQITIRIGWRHNVAAVLNLFKNPQPVYFFHSPDVTHIVESNRVPWHMNSLTRVKTGRAGLETRGGKQRCECD